jgi:hypothetical protein
VGRRGLIVAVALALAGAGCVGARPAGPRAVPRQVEVLLNDRLAAARGVGALAADFDVSPGDAVVLSDAEHLYALGWGGLAPLDGLTGVDSLAFTADGLLLTVRGDQLSYVDERGASAPMTTLPHAGLALAPGAADVMYLFDRAGAAPPYTLYALVPGRKVVKLLETPRPIDAVAQAGERVLLVSGGVVYEVTPGQPMRMVAHLGRSTITAVAGDRERVYVSDGAAVYALAQGGVVVVTDTAGGALRVRDGALLVLDPRRRLLVRLQPR